MAKKIKEIRHGITFDSKLEADIYDVFLFSDKCEIVDHHKTFEILPVIDYYNISKGKLSKLRKMDYTPDIIIRIDGVENDIAVEVKGFARPDYKMRKKLFVAKYHTRYNFIELKNIEETLKFLDKF